MPFTDSLVVTTHFDPEMSFLAGFNCAIFRNESERKASEVILECERIAVNRWGANRAYTYVDPRKTRVIKRRGERIVGFCFIQAGWRFAGLSKTGLHLLVKDEAGERCLGEPK